MSVICNAPGCTFMSPMTFSECPQCGGQDVSEWLTSVPQRGPSSLADIEPQVIHGGSTGTILDCLSVHGVPHEATVLLHGFPGVGKSRLALCAASGWCHGSPSHSAVYILSGASEGMTFQELHRMAQEHGLSHVERMYPVRHEECAVTLLQVTTPRFIVVDSIPDDAVGECQRWVAHVRDFPTDTVLLITQETKEGQYAGPHGLEHLVTISCALRNVQEREWIRSTGSDQPYPRSGRFLFVTKNRMGLTGTFGPLDRLTMGLA